MIRAKKQYLIIPIPKSPYYRIGPFQWQDWYRQVERTIAIAKKLKNEGGEVSITILSNFHPKDKQSEIELYESLFTKLAPELEIYSFKETNDTLGQVERSFELAQEMNAELVFVSAWMQFPRVVYLTHGRKAKHYGVFGIPSPIFAFVDPFAVLLQPLIIWLGLGNLFQRITVSRREKGTIW